jgi:hypothetical protein
MGFRWKSSALRWTKRKKSFLLRKSRYANTKIIFVSISLSHTFTQNVSMIICDDLLSSLPFHLIPPPKNATISNCYFLVFRKFDFFVPKCCCGSSGVVREVVRRLNYALGHIMSFWQHVTRRRVNTKWAIVRHQDLWRHPEKIFVSLRLYELWEFRRNYCEKFWGTFFGGLFVSEVT